MPESADRVSRHFTTRPSFVIFIGLLVLALYFMWAFYGAAPTSLRFLADAQVESTDGAAAGGHGSAAGGMTPDAFQEIAYKFVDDFGLADGSVRPTRQLMSAMAAMGGGHEDREDEAGGHRDSAKATEDGAATTEPDEASRKGSSAAMAAVVGRGDENEEPIDVYLMALQYSYVPSVLRLEHGVPYRFRMMSTDVNHGASIHSGFAGHIMRRPARTMVEMVMTFPERGEYMIYCTVYCGEGHSTMKGKIIVE